MDFLSRQKKLQAEAKLALAMAKPMAKMQVEVEKQNRKKSPVADLVSGTVTLNILYLSTSCYPPYIPAGGVYPSSQWEANPQPLPLRPPAHSSKVFVCVCPNHYLHPIFCCPHLEGGEAATTPLIIISCVFLSASLRVHTRTLAHSHTHSRGHAFHPDLQAEPLYLFRVERGSSAGSIYNSCARKHRLQCLGMWRCSAVRRHHRRIRAEVRAEC